MPMLARRRLMTLALLSLGLASSARAARWVELWPGDPTRPPSRAAHGVVLDAPGRRLIACGERIPTSEIWALALDGPAAWTRIPIAGERPAGRSGVSTILDTKRRRLVTFGGGYGEGGFPTANEVWVLSLDGTPRWQQLFPAGTVPDPRELHSAIYDPVRDRMLVFGGLSTPGPGIARYENSVWELTLGDTPTWRQLFANGPPPSPRIAASMVYDAAHDRAIVFGGNNPTEPTLFTYRNDVFELKLDDPPTWRALAPAGAPLAPRYHQAAVMDDARNRLLVFGGRGYNQLPFADTWALDLGTDPPAWSRAGPNASFPRSEAGAILDPVTDRLIVDGGFAGQGIGYHVDETIALSLAGSPSWHRIDGGPPAAPSRRVSPAPLVDPLTRRLIIEGGYDATTFGFYDTYAHPLAPADLWTWPLDSASPTWAPATTSGPVSFLDFGPAVLDPVRRQQVRFYQDPLDPVTPLHTHTGASVGVLPLDVPGVWTALVVSGGGPDYRQGFATAYDAAHDRILLAGGYTQDPRGYSYFYHHDVWSLSLTGAPAWTLLIDDVPDELQVFSDAMFYDPAGGQLVAVGYENGGPLGIWALADDGGSTWRMIAPIAANYTNASFDPATRELVGINLLNGEAYHLVLSDDAPWTEIEVTGQPPPPRRYSRLEFDPIGRRVLCFGGESNDAGLSTLAFGDLWALELDRATPAVILPGPDQVRLSWTTNLAAGSAVSLERRVSGASWAALGELHAGADGGMAYEDAAVSPGLSVDYRLRLGGSVLPGSEQHLVVSPRPALAFAGARPNPAIGRPSFMFTLSGLSPARLDVYDVTGRIVASRDVGSLGAGDHALGLQARLAPGLYVASLSQSGAHLTRRFVVAR